MTEIPYERLDALESALGGRAAVQAAFVAGRASSVPFNVKGFGAKGDGRTDDAAAIQSAINACIAAGGGLVYFPAGTYLYGTTLNFDQASGVTLRGDGGGHMPGNAIAAGGAAATLRYTGTGAKGISARTSLGTHLEGIRFDYNNAGFTGTLVDLSCPSTLASELTVSLVIRDCFFGGVGGASFHHRSGTATAACCLDISNGGSGIFGGNYDGAYQGVIDHCVFDNAVVGLTAQGAAWMTVQDCLFTAGLTSLWIQNPGTKVLYLGNTFDSTSAGPTGINYSGGNTSDVLQYIANGFTTDGFPTAGTAITFKGLRCILLGNFFAGGNTAILFANAGEEGSGGQLTVVGNVFDSWTAMAINFGSGNAQAPVFIAGNAFYNCGAKWPAGTKDVLALETPTGVGNGAAGNLTALAKGTGSGPASDQAATWIPISIGTQSYWIPAFQ